MMIYQRYYSKNQVFFVSKNSRYFGDVDGMMTLMSEQGEGTRQEPAVIRVIREQPIDLEPLAFPLEMIGKQAARREWRREGKENKARRQILQNVLIDREKEPLTREEIAKNTSESRRAASSLLGGERAGMAGVTTDHCIVFNQDEERFLVAHFHRGELQTLSQINLEEGGQSPPTRVVFTKSHEGRLESALEPGYELTRTAVHAFNFLTERAKKTSRRRSVRPVPEEFQRQVNQEVVTPEKLLLREDLFFDLNERYGEPFRDGGVLIVTDTKAGSPLGALTLRGPTKFQTLPVLGEVDDLMQIFICRGDEVLAEKVKAFGHTSRGTAFTQATMLAATIGSRTEAKPVFPGYCPYRQHNEQNDPIRVSPTVLAMLELGKAKSRGKEAVLVDQAPTTERVYATAIKLAQERGVDLSEVPAIFAVGVRVQEGAAELVDSKLLNWNYSLGDDCKRGLHLALDYFKDVTFFSLDSVNIGIPIADFEEFAKFMRRVAGGEYEELAEKMLIRAKNASSARLLFEAQAAKELGKPLKLPQKSFPAQDTLIGAYLAHPNWFETEEMPLKYVSDSEGEQEKKIRVITRMTEEGQDKFRGWLWDSIKANFAETTMSSEGALSRVQFNLRVEGESPFKGKNTAELAERHPELLAHPDILPTFDIVNPGQETAVVKFRGLGRRPKDVRAGTDEFLNWHENMFRSEVKDEITFIQVNYPQHTYVGDLIIRQCEDFLADQGIRRIHIVGGSYGGVPAYELARDIHTRKVGVAVDSISIFTGLTNEQEITPDAKKALRLVARALEVPRMLGFPTGLYAHARAVGIRLRGIPERPFTPQEMPPEAKVLLVCTEHDKFVDNERLINNVSRAYPDLKVSYLKGWHAITESQRAWGNRLIADFITAQVKE